MIRQTKADSIVALSKDLLKIKTSNVVTLTNAQLEPVTENTFSFVGDLKNERALYRWENYWGVVLSDGEYSSPYTRVTGNLPDVYLEPLPDWCCASLKSRFFVEPT